MTPATTGSLALELALMRRVDDGQAARERAAMPAGETSMADDATGAAKSARRCSSKRGLGEGGTAVVITALADPYVMGVSGGAADFWYPFRWTGFRPRAEGLDQPVDFAGPPVDSMGAPTDSAAPRDSAAPSKEPSPPPAQPVPPPRDSAVRRPAAGYTVSFAALLVADKARDLAASIRVGSENARVVTAVRDGSTIYRVVLGPYTTREEAERIGRESKQSYWIYEGGP